MNAKWGKRQGGVSNKTIVSNEINVLSRNLRKAAQIICIYSAYLKFRPTPKFSITLFQD